VSSAWRGEGPRYDCVLIQGHTARSFLFGQVYAFFALPLGPQHLHLAIIKEFKMFKLRNKTTGYIELSVPDSDPFQFIWMESIIRAAHIIPPTADNPRHTVQDLIDGDMYLRLR